MTDLPLASARFKYLERPIQNPGTCCVCGNPNRPVVDFGTNLHQRNSVWVLYICILCIKDAYDTVDILSGDREKRESGASQSLQSELDKKNLVAITREQFDALVHISTDYSSVIDSLVDSDMDFASEVDEESSPDVSVDNSEHDGGAEDLSLGMDLDDRKPTESVPSLTF